MAKAPHTGGERRIVPDWRAIGITRRIQVQDPSVGGKGYPPKPGHDVTSITYGESLMALSGQGQRIDLR